jgi:NTE family protein
MSAIAQPVGVPEDLEAAVLRDLADLPARFARSDHDRRPRIGVVLGAGGVLGNAYLSGAVAALRAVTGFEPRSAAVLVGTSAGSVHAAMYGIGLPAWFGLWRNRGGRLPDDVPPRTDALGHHRLVEPDLGERETLRDIFTPARAVPRPGPAAPLLAARALLAPWALRPEVLLSALLPEGVLSNVAIGTAFQRFVPSGWVPHPRTWITATSLRSGRRVVFGRPDGPRAHLDRAVRASCAIPGVYKPVRIGRDRFVDGGMHSPTNADLLAGLDLDLVVILSPMSALEGHAATGVVDRYLAPLRHLSSRRLAAEVRRLDDAGTRTVVLQPGRRDLAVFGRNLMDPRPRRQVAETALETTAQMLSEPEHAQSVQLLALAAASARARG